jgi:hypothetical protein
MFRRAIATFALALAFANAGVGQTPPVIDGQTGAVTITPQTLDWLRQRLADEQERLRQLQISIQQIQRAMAASQTAAQPIVPIPSQPTTTASAPIQTPEPPASLTPGATAPHQATRPGTQSEEGVTPRHPFTPTPGQAAAAPPKSALKPRPPFTPSPTRREAALVPTPKKGEPAPPHAAEVPTLIFAPPTEPATSPAPTTPAATLPPPTITVTPAPGGGTPASKTSRPPSIMIPTFAPKGAPSAIGGATDDTDRTGSPVRIAPGAEGDETDLNIEGIVGSRVTTEPSVLPLAPPLRPGLSMAEVRQIKGTPSLISRDDAAGTETWTYQDSRLTFRGGRLIGPRKSSSDAPSLAPVARPVTARAPTPARRNEPLTRRVRPAPTRQQVALRVSTPRPPTERVAGSTETRVERSAAPGRTNHRRTATRRTERVATWRGTAPRSRRTYRNVRTTRIVRTTRTTRTGHTTRVVRTTRTTHASRTYRMRRWAREHRRAHRRALRDEPSAKRAAILRACRKCQLARHYLGGTPHSSSRVAAWRATTPTMARHTTGKGVTITQRR